MSDQAHQNKTAETIPDASARQRRVWQTPKVILSDVAKTAASDESQEPDGAMGATS